MIADMKKKAFNTFLVSVAFALCVSCNNETKPVNSAYYTEQDFTTVSKIDAHVHVNTFDTSLIGLARSFGFKLISLNVEAPEYPSLSKQQQYCLFHQRQNGNRIAYTTSFSMQGFGSSTWLHDQLQYLKSSFNNGAVGVKVWKHIGMELKDSDGRFIMIDDPRMDSIFSFISNKNKTLVGHLGEPRNCWLPLDQMTVKNDRDYFSKHPEYHMALHPEFPSYEEQIAARDRLLMKHPSLRFDGAHLGSLEWSVDSMARHLDRFPNTAFDMAERISHLQYQSQKDRKKVIDFIEKYQDRLIYATDIVQGEGDDITALKNYCTSTWKQHWTYFTSDNMMRAPEIEGEFQALHLPKTIIDKIYRKNAEKWFPDAFPQQTSNAGLAVAKTSGFAVDGTGTHVNWEQTSWQHMPALPNHPSHHNTSFKMLYSDSGIYVLFQCADSLLTNTNLNDGDALYNEDVVEVFLQPDTTRAAYFEYELSPLNRETALLIFNKNGDLNSWQPFELKSKRKIVHATSISGGTASPKSKTQQWTAEMFIPFDLLYPLGVSTPVTGKTWKANFYRIDYDTGEALWTWKPNSGNFHEYQHFGSIYFE